MFVSLSPAACLPDLAVALNQQFEVTQERVLKAKLKIDEREVQLQEHQRVFGLEAPTEQRDLETRVKEMKVSVGLVTLLYGRA